MCGKPIGGNKCFWIAVRHCLPPVCGHEWRNEQGQFRQGVGAPKGNQKSNLLGHHAFDDANDQHQDTAADTAARYLRND